MKTLTKSELDHLAQVIGECERGTTGEIRLMLVKRSSATGHVHILTWSLLVSFALLLLSYLGREEMLWTTYYFAPLLLVAAWVVSGFLCRLPLLQRRLTPLLDLTHQVLARAEVEFHREGLSDTTTHTGVLIFVSLFERQCVVLADKAIADKVDNHAWDQVVRLVIDGARSGRGAEKLEQALRACGQYLKDHFPAPEGRQNELSNEVIVKD